MESYDSLRQKGLRRTRQGFVGAGSLGGVLGSLAAG